MDAKGEASLNRKLGIILAGLVVDAGLMFGVVVYAAKVAFGG